MTHTLTFTLRTYRYTFRWCPYFYEPTLSLFNTITFHFSQFLFTFFAKITCLHLNISVHNQIKGFGLWWPYAMCLWPYVPEFLRWAALKNALSYSIVLTYMYIRMYVYVCLDSPNLRACPCYVRACVRALTRSSARGAHAATLPAACTGHACARWQLFRENSSVKWQLPSYLLLSLGVTCTQGLG